MEEMKRAGLPLCLAAMVALAATAASAQTCPVAQLISPTPGSTLPAGAVTFEWCNANADYFLTVESIPGAHDIFNAFAGGVGPGAGVVSVTLGPACAPTVPTGCIPTNGETIYVALWTLRKGIVVPPSPFNYTFTAANTAPPPAGFFVLTPCRVIDTRDTPGPLGGPALSAGAPRSFVIMGQCGIPPGATAVSVNVTITQPSSGGFVTVYPGGSPLPPVSTINYRPGQTRANNAIVTVGPSGDITAVSGQPTGTIHCIVDVNGYFQ